MNDDSAQQNSEASMQVNPAYRPARVEEAVQAYQWQWQPTPGQIPAFLSIDLHRQLEMLQNTTR